MYRKYLFEFLKEIYHKVMSSVLYGYMVSKSQSHQSQLVPPHIYRVDQKKVGSQKQWP